MKINTSRLIGLLFLAILFSSCKNNTKNQNESNQPTLSFVDTLEYNINPISTVTIGNQTWMVNNLDVSTFRNGDSIQEAKTNEEWINASKNHIPAWCYYDNDLKNGRDYGKLYNWFAVMDERGLAPIGYHVPNNEEFDILQTNSGGSLHQSIIQSHQVANKLKAKINLWKTGGLTPDDNGFNALPGGVRSDKGGFYGINEEGHWWTSRHGTQHLENFGVSHFDIDDYVSGPGAPSYGPGQGLSVRCIKGEDTASTIKIPIVVNEMIEYDENEKPKQGEWTVTGPSGGINARKHFIDGIEEGQRINYYYGVKISEGNYIKGIQEGEWIYYNDNYDNKEVIRAKGNFLNGKKDGEWRYYTRNIRDEDEIKKVEVYKKDSIVNTIYY